MKRSIFFQGGTLVLDKVGEMEQVPNQLQWIKGRWRCEAYHYHELHDWLREQQIRDNVAHWVKVELQLYDTREPHDYQIAALKAWNDAGQRGSVILPTGAGKTFVAIQAIVRAARSTIICCPTLALLHQWYSILVNAFHTEIGVYYGAEKNIQPLTVTTYHSAGDFIAEHGNKFKLIIWDELHHLPAPTWGEAALMAPCPLRLGLTATYPQEHEQINGRWHVDTLVGPIVYRQGIDDLVGEQLAKYRTERVRIDLTSEERKQYDSDFEIYVGFLRSRQLQRTHGAGQLQELMRLSAFDKEARRAFQARTRMLHLVGNAENKFIALDNLLREYNGERTLIFTEFNHVAYVIARRFLIPVISHETKVAERKQILDNFGSGRYRAIVTSKVLNEGIDVPEAKLAIIMGGASGTREFVQRLGRVLRKVENREAVLFEIIARKTLEESRSQHRNQNAYR